jgi:hypothetical protein
MPKRDGLPALVRVLLLLSGVAALGIAVVSALFAVGIDGRPDDVILAFGGRQVGGTTDTLIALLSALLFGAGGVACVLKSWRDLTQRDPSPTRAR